MRLIAILLAAASVAAQPANPSGWHNLEFLLGKWTGVAGEKETPLGAGQGAFSFTPELSNKVIVRRNTAAYTSGASHDDLMIVYFDGPPSAPPRAIYFDSEDHVIRYDVEPSPDGSSVRFLSKYYRLTYTKTGSDTLAIKFEIAPPDQPGAYKTYIDATARRVRN